MSCIRIHYKLRIVLLTGQKNTTRESLHQKTGVASKLPPLKTEKKRISSCGFWCSSTSSGRVVGNRSTFVFCPSHLLSSPAFPLVSLFSSSKPGSRARSRSHPEMFEMFGKMKLNETLRQKAWAADDATKGAADLWFRASLVSFVCFAVGHLFHGNPWQIDVDYGLWPVGLKL